MPWTETTRRQYERRSARYASDLTDDEWALIAPLMPLAICSEPRSQRSVSAPPGPYGFGLDVFRKRYFAEWRDEGVIAKFNEIAIDSFVLQKDAIRHRRLLVATPNQSKLAKLAVIAAMTAGNELKEENGTLS